MRAIAIDAYGGPEELTVHQLPAPEPGPGEVLVRTTAIGVNPVDLAQRSGAAKGAMADVAFPIVLGWDVAGVVAAVGDDVTRFAVGDRVIGMSLWFATRTGTYAEQVVLPEGSLAPAPVGVDDTLAATIPLNGLTAWRALAVADVQPGERLLVLGAAGSVGGFIVQLAAQRGIEVVGLGREADHATITGLGAVEAVDAATAARDIAVAIDTTGTPNLALEAMTSGRLLTLGAKPSVEQDAVAVRGVGVRDDAAALTELAEQVGTGRLQLRLAQTYPLADAGEAHRRVAAGGRRGGVVLIP